MVSLKQRNILETQAKLTPEPEKSFTLNPGELIQSQFELSQIDPALYASQQFNQQQAQNFIDPNLPQSSTQAPQTGTPHSATPQLATHPISIPQRQQSEAEVDADVDDKESPAAHEQERRRSGRLVRPPKRELETISPVRARTRQRTSKQKESQKQEAAVGDGTVERVPEVIHTPVQDLSSFDTFSIAGPSQETPKRKQAMRNSGRVDRRTGAYVQYPNPKALKLTDQAAEVPIQQHMSMPPPPVHHQGHPHQPTPPPPYHGVSFQQAPYGDVAFPNMGLPHGHVAMQAQPPPPTQHPLIQAPTVPPPPDAVPIDSSIPDPDHDLVPYESCLTLRKWGIDPNFVLIPPRGQPCPFAEKKSQCKGRTDWNRSSWERHVFGHLPDKLKPYWQCPVCMRTFARKDSFKRHFGLKKDSGGDGEGIPAGEGGKCWSEGNLAGIPENEWASKWLFEPVVVRFPDTQPKYRRMDQSGIDIYSTMDSHPGPDLGSEGPMSNLHHDMGLPHDLIPITQETMAQISRVTLERIAQAAMADQYPFGLPMP